MTAFAKFQRSIRNRQWHAHAPITRAVHPETLAAVNFDHVHGASGGAFRFGIQRHTAPKSSIEHHLHRVFLDVINQTTFRLDARVGAQHIEDEARAFEFIFEMRRVDEDELVVLRSEVNVHFQHLKFIA